MLKSLHLKNVKGHRDSLLELSPGLNVITGDTDAGKSTFSRAFNWLITNQRGYNPRPWKHLKPRGPSQITVETVEGNVISRIKHTGINAYELDGEVFKALGSDVPDEIQNALRLQPVNLQAQKDAYYLLNDTPGQVAKEFNRIANLEKMDGAIQAIQRMKVSKQQELDRSIEDVEAEDRKLEKLRFVRYAETELADLEERQTTFDTQSTKVGEVEGVVDVFIQAKENAEQIVPPEFFDKFKALQGREINRLQLGAVTSVVEEYLEAGKALWDYPEGLGDDLDYLTGKLEDLQAGREEVVALWVKVHACDSSGIAPIQWQQDWCYLGEALDKLRGGKDKVEEVRKTLFDLNYLENYQTKKSAEIETATAKLEELKKNLKLCGECGRPL